MSEQSIRQLVEDAIATTYATTPRNAVSNGEVMTIAGRKLQAITTGKTAADLFDLTTGEWYGYVWRVGVRDLLGLPIGAEAYIPGPEIALQYVADSAGNLTTSVVTVATEALSGVVVFGVLAIGGYLLYRASK